MQIYMQTKRRAAIPVAQFLLGNYAHKQDLFTMASLAVPSCSIDHALLGNRSVEWGFYIFTRGSYSSAGFWL